MRRALDTSSGTVPPTSGTERREGSLRGLGAMIRLANVRHAAPVGEVLSDELALLDNETTIRRATLLADGIERLDQLAFSREDATSATGLSPSDLDHFFQGRLDRFDEETLANVLGRLAGAATAFEGGDGAEERA